MRASVHRGETCGTELALDAAVDEFDGIHHRGVCRREKDVHSVGSEKVLEHLVVVEFNIVHDDDRPVEWI